MIILNDFTCSKHKFLLGYYAAPDVPIEIKVLKQVGASGWSVQIGCHITDWTVSLPSSNDFRLSFSWLLQNHEEQRRPPLIYLTESLSPNSAVQISLHYGGLVFLQSPDASECSITVSLNNVVLTPTYDLADPNRITNWQYRQRNAQGLWADLAGHYIAFNIPSKSVLHLTSTQLEDVLSYFDSAVLAHHDLRGTKPTFRERVVQDVDGKGAFCCEFIHLQSIVLY